MLLGGRRPWQARDLHLLPWRDIIARILPGRTKLDIRQRYAALSGFELDEPNDDDDDRSSDDEDGGGGGGGGISGEENGGE
eukprot:SM010464S13926  [mRNA]  locus=s10464:2:360:- [translate_table: standard]